MKGKIKMKKLLSENNIIYSYVALVFLLSYLWQLIIYLTGGVDSALFPFLMFFPGLVAIVFRIISKEGFRNVGWGLKRWWYIFAATIIPIIVVVLAIFVIISMNLGDFSNERLNFGASGVDVIGYPLLLGKGQQSYLFFALNFFVTLLVQSVGSGLLSFGEEFGWRGYLQGKMVDRFGLNRGLIFLGVVWGYWHLPVVLMGYNFPTSPVLGALLLMPLGCVFMGIFLGWIYLVSKSIWMPMIAHGAMNLTAMLMLNEIIMTVDKLYQGLIFIGAWGVIAALFIIILNMKYGEVQKKAN